MDTQAGLDKKTSEISVFYYLLAMILRAVKYLPSKQVFYTILAYYLQFKHYFAFLNLIICNCITLLLA